MYLGSVGAHSGSPRAWATLKPNATNIAMGIIFVYQAAGPTTIAWSAIPYFSVSLSLNVLLTLMIVIRLILHARGVRTAMGGIGSGRLCKAIATMFIESCAINSVTSLLLLGLFGAGNDAMDAFLPILPQTQVRAFPLLRSLEWPPNVATGWIDYRCTFCRSSSRQQECTDERYSCLRTYQYVQSKEPRGVDGRELCRSWWRSREFCG